MRAILCALMFLAAAARGQDTNLFHAYASAVDLIEGGRVPIVVVDWGDLHCTMRCPVGYASHVDNFGHTIRFDTKAGSVAVNVIITTNSPGQLPETEELKALASARHPNSWFLQSTTFPTGYRPGVYVDLAQAPAANVIVRVRHGFLPTPRGLVEFMFSASDKDFEKQRVLAMQAIGTFTVEAVKPKDEGQSGQ